MAKKILRTVYFFLTFPLIIFSNIARKANLWGVKDDLEYCFSVLDHYSSYPIPDNFIKVLTIAEDKRSHYHFGVDPFGILRAIWVYICHNRLQGASTIEQQFARVATNCYELSLRRKLKEQSIAIAISMKRDKRQVMSAYLCLAHYGHGLNGMLGLKSICDDALSSWPEGKIREAIAQLKYPKPRYETWHWHERIKKRKEYILRLESKRKTWARMRGVRIHKYKPAK